jgi:hypothetical protein
MCLAVGVVYFFGIHRRAWEVPAMWVAVWTAAGLLLGRLLTLAIDGGVGQFIYYSIACEIASIGLGLYLLRPPAAVLTGYRTS